MKHFINSTESGNTGVVAAPQNLLPMASLFLGPHAENADHWIEAFNEIIQDYMYWRRNYYPQDGFVLDAKDICKGEAFFTQFRLQLMLMLSDLRQSFPFYSPRYMGHMLSEQSLPAVMGYFATMLFNPNNVTEEAAPITVAKELEFGKMICKMVGYSTNGWAHLCSGGSNANLEALWAARQSQFFAVVLWGICKKNNWSLPIKLPDYKKTKQYTPITACSARQILHLNPTDSIYLLSTLTDYLRHERGYTLSEAMDMLENESAASPYNIRIQGYGTVTARLGLKPVLFVPQSAHYSLKKTANILGYGEGAIRPIPNTEKFRIDVTALEELIKSVADDEYVAAVVCVFGTTEEGAVDPVHRVKWLRDRIALEKGVSFWLHVDAAWGGYFAVMKNHDGMAIDTYRLINNNQEDFFASVDRYIREVDVSEKYTVEFKSYCKEKTASWNDREVFAAMFALSSADSITVDPHKMGYVPYPAGVVAFRNKRIVYLLQQHASYIGTDSQYIQGTSNGRENSLEANFFKPDDKFEIPQIGAYTLEGSRPGSAAVACWFAAKVIPLDIHGHGKIIRTTVLNAKRFAQYLQQHRRVTFWHMDQKLQVEAGLTPCKTPFSIELLYNNIDTNIVCFFVRPMKWAANFEETIHKQGFPAMEQDPQWTLSEINEINRRIHERLTISPSKEADSRKISLYQKFYVAGTEFNGSMYSAESMRKTLERFQIDEWEYRKNGLYVMRSTIMNPWYYQTAHSENHTEYFLEFLKELHYATRRIIDEMEKKHRVKLFKNR